jgi:hypothetical protein
MANLKQRNFQYEEYLVDCIQLGVGPTSDELVKLIKKYCSEVGIKPNQLTEKE